jgi:hypothetical protein
MADELEGRWDETDERERKIRSLGVARRRRRLPAKEPEALSLREGLQAQRFVSGPELRELADRTYEQPVVSVYLNLTPEQVIRRPPVYLSMFNSMRHREFAARRDLIQSLSRKQRYSLYGDMDVVEELLGMLRPAGTRSIVIFKSGRELNRVFTLPVRAADSLTIDADPYLEPLEAILEGHPRCLVVDVHKEESRFWIHHLGELVQVERVESFTPTDTVDAGRPGKVQRHRLTHLGWHLKTSAQVATRLFGEHGLGLLVLAGEERVLTRLEHFLPDTLQARVAGRLHPSPQAVGADWQRDLERVLAEHRRAEEEAALNLLEDYMGRGLLVSGLAGVIEVANRFLVRRLFVSVELTQPGCACRQHHFLSLWEGRCPFCGGELFPTTNVTDELIELARLHGVELMVVEERPELLEPYAGAAAVTYEPGPAE